MTLLMIHAKRPCKIRFHGAEQEVILIEPIEIDIPESKDCSKAFLQIKDYSTCGTWQSGFDQKPKIYSFDSNTGDLDFYWKKTKRFHQNPNLSIKVKLKVKSESLLQSRSLFDVRPQPEYLKIKGISSQLQNLDFLIFVH